MNVNLAHPMKPIGDGDRERAVRRNAVMGVADTFGRWLPGSCPEVGAADSARRGCSV